MTAETAETRRLRAHIRRLERELRKAEDARLSFAEVQTRILDLSAAPAKPPRWVKGLGSGSAQASRPGTPVLCLSDWHAGETVRLEETGGVNAFNSSILERRVNRVVEKALALAMNHTVNPVYAGIVVPLLGDFVSGEIHDELTRTNDLGVFPSIIRAADLLTAALNRLADVFGSVYAPAVCGNHGRFDRRWQVKSFTVRNADWLVYQIVRQRVGERIVIDCREDNEAEFEVEGLRILAVHGHDLGVKGGDGMIGALGPIMRGRLKLETQKAAQGKRFDLLMMGHWHFDAFMPGLMVVNTLKGYDEFARSSLRAKPTPPSQTLFFVHPQHGITSYWRVFADSITRKGDHR